MSHEIPDDVKRKLMEDPQVQEALRRQAQQTGSDVAEALKDPAVQQKIMAVCQEKFPEYAGIAGAKIKEFAMDPHVQAEAKRYAGMAMGALGGGIISQIEQGPTGVKMLAFIGGAISCVDSGMIIMAFPMILTNTAMYVLAVYQVMFSLTTMLFEAKPEWIQAGPKFIDEYQNLLIDKAKFLTETVGRGLFYIFQGTLWLCFASLTSLLNLFIGLYFVFVGVLNLLLHFGGYTEFAAKLSKGYEQLSQQGAA